VPNNVKRGINVVQKLIGVPNIVFVKCNGFSLNSRLILLESSPGFSFKVSLHWMIYKKMEVKLSYEIVLGEVISTF
jgi:hypothetical protein